MASKVQTKSQKVIFDLASVLMANDSYPSNVLLLNAVHALLCISEGELDDARSDIHFIDKVVNK